MIMKKFSYPCTIMEYHSCMDVPAGDTVYPNRVKGTSRLQRFNCKSNSIFS